MLYFNVVIVVAMKGSPKMDITNNRQGIPPGLFTDPSNPEVVPYILDVITYNGEPILEIRIPYLYNHVDEFIIVEARRTFSGLPKEGGLFCESAAFKERFAPYMDKIKVLAVEDFPDTAENVEKWLKNVGRASHVQDGTEDSWFREYYQRNFAAPYIYEKYISRKDANARPFIAIVSDSDEIPRSEHVQALRENPKLWEACRDTPVYMEMDFFYYNFNWRKKEPWYFAYFISQDTFTRYGGDLTYLRCNHPKEQVLRDAGWHCSYFSSRDELRRKLASFSHREFDRDEFKTDAHLDDCLVFGRDLFLRGEHEDLVRSDSIAALGLPGATAFQLRLLDIQQSQAATSRKSLELLRS